MNLQIVFLTFLNILAFVSPALFMFTVHIAMILFKVTVISGSFISNYLTGEGGIFLIYTVDFIYLMSFLALIFFSMHLTNRNQKFVPYIYAVATLLGILSIMIFVLLAFEIFSVTEASKNFIM